MSENSTRQAWIEQARAGDARAISKLLAAFYPALRAQAAARMDPSVRAKFEPEDVLQEVYLDVLRQINNFTDNDPRAFLNWVLTILDSKLVDFWRALHRKVRDVDREMPAQCRSRTESYWNLLDQVSAGSPTPSRDIRREEAVGALLASITHLPEQERRVVQLRFLEGLAVKQVAEQLGKTPAAVVAMTRRGLESLRAEMNRMGEFTRG